MKTGEPKDNSINDTSNSWGEEKCVKEEEER
jgi:hypothetical protein